MNDIQKKDVPQLKQDSSNAYRNIEKILEAKINEDFTEIDFLIQANDKTLWFIHHDIINRKWSQWRELKFPYLPKRKSYDENRNSGKNTRSIKEQPASPQE